ncbi:MAG: SOS response-associated peptidase [Micavibrio sp.]|nr:SOS response-associated peptidase [Micavibrio sp.]
MSIRFTVIKKFEELAAHYNASPFGGKEWLENYNVTPNTMVPVLVDEPEGRELRLMQWGLIPFWAKDRKIGNAMINARADEAQDKPGFRDSFKDKRCIIPATGFYEWQKLTSVKLPYYVTPKAGLFSFAGLWSRWISPESVEVETFSIITTTANDVVKPVSDRMPVCLPSSGWSPWLAKGTRPNDLQELLRPLPGEQLGIVPVSKYVNALKSSGPKCIAPIDGH